MDEKKISKTAMRIYRLIHDSCEGLLVPEAVKAITIAVTSTIWDSAKMCDHAANWPGIDKTLTDFLDSVIMTWDELEQMNDD